MRRKSNLPLELDISIDAAGVRCNACSAAATVDSEDRERDMDREAVNNRDTVFMMIFTS
jgi:hypothetical protein